MITKTSSLVVLALVSAIALTGCTADAAPPKPRSDASAPAQPSPPPTPDDQLEGKASGDPIDAELAATIDQSWLELTDDKAYQMPDGTFVLIKGGEPLPEKVVQAVTAVVKPLAARNYQARDYDQAASEAMFSAQRAQEDVTGRKAAYVVHAWGPKAAGGWEPRWSVGGDTPGYSGTSKDEAMAVASGWVNQNPNTRMLIVIDTFE